MRTTETPHTGKVRILALSTPGATDCSIAEHLNNELRRVMLDRYGVRVVNCSDVLDCRWVITKDDELIIAPNLRSDDIEKIEDCLARRRGSTLRPV